MIYKIIFVIIKNAFNGLICSKLSNKKWLIENFWVEFYLTKKLIKIKNKVKLYNKKLIQNQVHRKLKQVKNACS